MNKTTAKPVQEPPKEMFASGGLSGEGRHEGGKRHGKWKFHYSDGR